MTQEIKNNKICCYHKNLIKLNLKIIRLNKKKIQNRTIVNNPNQFRIIASSVQVSDKFLINFINLI